MQLKMILLVGLGGFVGTIARYLSGLLVNSILLMPGLSTLVVNLLGSFLIGLVYALGSARGYGSELMALLTIGVLGGFTTFSAFSVETMLFLKDGRLMWAAGYVLTMVISCLLATYLGFWAAKFI